MITKVQFWAAPSAIPPRPSRPLIFHMTGHTHSGNTWSLCGTARRLADHKRTDASTVPIADRCRAIGCADAWPPLHRTIHSPAALCQTDHCNALATHTTTRLGTTEAFVLCHWCAARYRHRYYPAVTLIQLGAYDAALAAATPAGHLYRITTGLLGDPQPSGTCNAAEARLRLERACRDGWAIQVQAAGGWSAADITTGFVGELTQAITLAPYPVGF